MPSKIDYYGKFRERHFLTFPTLETKRFLLLKCDKNYERNFEELLSDEEINKYTGTEVVNAKEECNIYLDHIDEEYKNKTALNWVIIDKEKCEFTGEIRLYSIDLYSNRCELGYTIVKKNWRKRIATECILRVLNFAFNELYMNKVSALIDMHNIASKRLIKLLGFAEEGILREHYYSFKRKAYITVEVWSMIKKDNEFYTKTLKI